MYFTVWKSLFWQKFRESNGFTKEATRVDFTKYFSGEGEFLVFSHWDVCKQYVCVFIYNFSLKKVRNFPNFLRILHFHEICWRMKKRSLTIIIFWKNLQWEKRKLDHFNSSVHVVYMIQWRNEKKFHDIFCREKWNIID